MGAVKKKQHYVPRFYLRYFTDSEKKFYVYDFDTNKLLPERAYYESQCYRKYFYGEDGVLEEQLSQKEGAWATVCKKAIAGNVLDESEIILLKEFILYQKQRTSDYNNHLRKERESIIKEYARQLYYHKGWKFDEDAEKICKQRAAEEITPAENTAIASEMLKYIQDLSVLVIRYSTDNTLLTTDSPVVTLNAFMLFQGFGYDCMGVAFLMPLSPKVLLVIYDGYLYKNNKGHIYVESKSKEEVMQINRYEMIHAGRMCYSADKSNFDLLTDEILDYRQKEEERKRSYFLGPEKSQRLIISQAEGTRYYYELPYTVLPREYRRIPYNCREAIPRHFEKGWEEKLALKYKVLNMAKKNPHNSETERLLPSKTDIKIGCRRMEHLAKIYWKEKGYNL